MQPLDLEVGTSRSRGLVGATGWVWWVQPLDLEVLDPKVWWVQPLDLEVWWVQPLDLEVGTSRSEGSVGATSRSRGWNL